MEQSTYCLLSDYMRENHWPLDFVYFTPTSNNTLKHIFKHSSKKLTGNPGRPDRFLYDTINNVLIIFECKSCNTENCKADLILYKNLMQNVTDLNVFYCAFVGTERKNITYIFYDRDMNELYINNFSYDNFIVKQVNKPNCIDKGMLEKTCHKLHNDLRNHTRLNDSDKPLFISAILLAFKDDYFVNLIKCDTIVDGSTLTNVILGIIRTIESTDEFIETFSFMKTHLDRLQLYDFCKYIYNTIICKNYTVDLLNAFYTEFVKYENTDSKSLGIVLTPTHIVSLMTMALKLKVDDTVLDLCSGTGSFLCESLFYKPQHIIGCETQSRLVNLFKINMHLRNVKNYTIYNDNCFNVPFQCTKSVINPPYGSDTELDFVKKQLQSVSDGGICASIFPVSKLINNKSNNIRKKYILENSKVKFIIKCNPQLFYPTANAHTCIMIIEKHKDGNIDNKTIFIDYSDDGILIEKHKGKLRTDTFTSKYKNVSDIIKTGDIVEDISYKKTLICEMDWVYMKQNNNMCVNKYNIDMLKLDMEYNSMRIQIERGIKQNITIPFDNYACFKIGDIFDTFKGKSLKTTSSEGEYPLIGASKTRNGVIKYVSDYKFEKAITIATNGSVGESFMHNYKFNATADICVLKPKMEMFDLFDMDTALYICVILKQIGSNYSYGYKWNQERIRNEVIKLPVNPNTNRINIKI